MKITRIPEAPPVVEPEKPAWPLNGPIIDEDPITHKVTQITNKGQRVRGVRENRPGRWQAYCREEGKWKNLYQGTSLGEAIDARLWWEANRAPQR